MDIESFVRVARALIYRYHGDTWIDYDIVPSMVITLLEEFPEIDRKAVLDHLDEDASESGWSSAHRKEVEDYFKPRFFVTVKNPENGNYLYWRSEWRDLVPDRSKATRFKTDEEARKAIRECIGMGVPLVDHGDYVKAATGPFEIVSIDYPAWIECEIQEAD